MSNWRSVVKTTLSCLDGLVMERNVSLVVSIHW